MKKPLNIPKFQNAEEEFAFFANLDLAEYFDPADFHRASFPNLQPTSQRVTMRIPRYLVARLKERANVLGIAYQALIKEAIAEKLSKSTHRT